MPSTQRIGSLGDASVYFYCPDTKSSRKTAGGCLTPNMKEGGAKCCRGNIVTKISGLIEDEQERKASTKSLLRNLGILRYFHKKDFVD